MKVVVGIDIGSWSFKINAYNNSQFTLLTNEANFRETPSLVAFHESHRLVGEEANNKVTLIPYS
jgi:molecular chaperone DnaK (HSP70)